MKIGIVSLFPEMFTALHFGVTGRALKSKILTLNFFNPRDFSLSKHQRVDDRSYGGGPGMVMQVQPVRDAIRAAKNACSQAQVLCLSPQGQLLTQRNIIQLAQSQTLILVSGRYEGIDERLLQHEIDQQCSVGDYILSGGELASMVMIDAITRLLPGALGHCESAQQDSFSGYLLDYPHYTRPEEIDGMKVPKVLLSGNHTQIMRWRLKQSLGKTWQLRPDMLKKHILTADEQALLAEFQEDTLNEHSSTN